MIAPPEERSCPEVPDGPRITLAFGMNAGLKREGQAGKQEYRSEYDEQRMLPSRERRLRSPRPLAEAAAGSSVYRERCQHYREHNLSNDVRRLRRSVRK